MESLGRESVDTARGSSSTIGGMSSPRVRREAGELEELDEAAEVLGTSRLVGLRDVFELVTGMQQPRRRVGVLVRGRARDDDESRETTSPKRCPEKVYRTGSPFSFYIQ